MPAKASTIIRRSKQKRSPESQKTNGDLFFCVYLCYNEEKGDETVQLKTVVHDKLDLTGNKLKIIAAVSMLIDHIGLIFLPHLTILRILGRLAMPIFAYMIAEGCRYTKNKLRYFLGVFILGVLCQVVYMLAGGGWYLCIPLSFSLSILLIFALQGFFRVSKLWAFALIAGIALVYRLTCLVHLDYGFWGCMLAVFAAVPMQWDVLDRRWSVLTMGVAMIPLAQFLGGVQWWSFLALPFLLLYNGNRGKLRMKYFFYIFYPAHLGLLQGLYWILSSI